MKNPPFTYHRPASLDEALALLAEHGDEAKVLAGGQSLLPVMALRLGRPEHLIDINRIPGLDQISVSDDVDALIIAENGFPGFQPSSQLYDWFGPQPRDMLLFSVRRGSAIIGTIDSLQGLAIQPGDILTVPLPTAPDPGQAPAIVIAAVALLAPSS